jgi:hypothetical protein
MPAYIRTSRRTGISMPFWLVPVAALVWVTVLFAYWLGLLTLAAGIWAVRGGRWAWLRTHRR